MACAKSPDVPLDTSPKHVVASAKSPSPDVAWYVYQTPDVYRTAHTRVDVTSTLDISCLKFEEEHNKPIFKS